MNDTARSAWIGAGVLWFALAAAASAAELQLTVEAGKHDRSHTPVKVSVTLPAELADEQSATLVLADGRVVPGQLTRPSLLAEGEQPADREPGTVARELHFVLPSLEAGEQTEAEVVVGQPRQKLGHFAWHDTPGEYAELSFGDGQRRPVMRYVYKALDESSKEAREQTYKPFHHLFDPSGERLVTKGPGGQFTHHRGLFYGFNRISYGDGKKADTWHAAGDAYQSHEGFLSQEAGAVLGRHRVAIDWHGEQKEVFAKEEREMSVYQVPGGLLVEFASRLRTTGGPVRLDGDPQHAGFQFRAAQEVAEKTKGQTYYLRPDGKGAPGQTKNWPGVKDFVNLPWNAMSFVVGGERYTAAYLDHPQNPKEARYSERDYGRFGSYFEYELTEEKPLELNYRVWLQEGEMSGTEVASLAADFVEPPRVEVKRAR